jgi:hypothetical protein
MTLSATQNLKPPGSSFIYANVGLSIRLCMKRIPLSLSLSFSLCDYRPITTSSGRTLSVTVSVTTLAGGELAGYVDGKDASKTLFGAPLGLLYVEGKDVKDGGGGVLYCCDNSNHAVRAITLDGLSLLVFVQKPQMYMRTRVFTPGNVQTYTRPCVGTDFFFWCGGFLW